MLGHGGRKRDPLHLSVQRKLNGWRCVEWALLYHVLMYRPSLTLAGQPDSPCGALSLVHIHPTKIERHANDATCPWQIDSPGINPRSRIFRPTVVVAMPVSILHAKKAAVFCVEFSWWRPDRWTCGASLSRFRCDHGGPAPYKFRVRRRRWAAACDRVAAVCAVSALQSALFPIRRGGGATRTGQDPMWSAGELPEAIEVVVIGSAG
jgi:hypothetical protein